MTKSSAIAVSLCLALFTAGCTTTTANGEHSTSQDKQISIGKSYLHGNDGIFNESDIAKRNERKPSDDSQGLTRLANMKREDVLFKSSQLAQKFSETELVKVSANKMSVQDFIHYVYGELLSVNYMLSPEASKAKDEVTLSLKEDISKRRLFELAESVLSERSLKLKYNNNVYLIAKVDPQSKSSTVVGFGRDLETIPSGNKNILQIVPVLYGIKTSLKTTVEQLADVSIHIDAKQGALFIRGDYANVSRSLELVQLLDSPANRGRHIGLVKLVYSSTELYLQQLSTLLENEGIPNAINDPGNNNLAFVPLQQIGAVAVFAATEELFKRVEFWTKMLDKPSEGDVKQYYVFHPEYARAQDIGESLLPLISARSTAGASSVSSTAIANKKDSSGSKTGQLATATRKTGGSNSDMTFVVDERSNALIFYTTGTEYRNIIPLINRLDVLPKQVLLDIMIAEVTLTDDFQFGVKWALENGRFSGGTIGDVTAGTGGFGFLFGNGQGESIQAAFSQKDSHIKILSNPSILVRDGVTASLDIGTDIAIVGSVIEGVNENDRVTTTNDYRKTGISVSVTPTVNAKGVVIMDIVESISNEVDTEGGGNPNIFERNLATAVVAESGQTIILGGLIDEKTNLVERKIPGLGDLPLLGSLFKSQSDNVTETELVLMVTPKVISRSDQWNSIMSSFESHLTNLKISK